LSTYILFLFLCFSAQVAGARVLVLGIAKSGTSALFNVVREGLEKKKGGCIKYVYEPFLGGSEDELSKDIKLTKFVVGELRSTRKPSATFLDQHEQIVFIFRDPRDLLVSVLIYLCKIMSRYGTQNAEKSIQAIELICEKIKNPRGISFRDTFEKSMLLILGSADADHAKNTNWHNVLADIPIFLSLFKQYKHKSIALKYEDFVADKLKPVEEFLDLELHYKKLLSDERGGGNFARDGSPGNWKQWFTPEDTAYYRELLSPWSQDLPYDLNETNETLTFDPQLLKSTLEYILAPLDDCSKKNPECAKVVAYFKAKYPQIDLQKIPIFIWSK